MNKKLYQKILITLAGLLGGICLMSGCVMKEEGEEKLRDLEFTVVAEEEQPDALKEVIAQKKTNPFQISYVLGEDLYIAVGYGEQKSCGYSISVNELYETENTIVMDTTLAGPQVQEQAADTLSYPYVVVKTENIDGKTMEFR